MFYTPKLHNCHLGSHDNFTCALQGLRHMGGRGVRTPPIILVWGTDPSNTPQYIPEPLFIFFFLKNDSKYVIPMITLLVCKPNFVPTNVKIQTFPEVFTIGLRDMRGVHVITNGRAAPGRPSST